MMLRQIFGAYTSPTDAAYACSNFAVICCASPGGARGSAFVSRLNHCWNTPDEYRSANRSIGNRTMPRQRAYSGVKTGSGHSYTTTVITVLMPTSTDSVCDRPITFVVAPPVLTLAK